MAVPINSSAINSRLAAAGEWFDAVFAAQGLTRLQGYGLVTAGLVLLLLSVILVRRATRPARPDDRRHG